MTDMHLYLGQDADFRKWEDAAKDENWTLPVYEDQTPGVPGWLKAD